jgi:hypothetical protein
MNLPWHLYVMAFCFIARLNHFRNLDKILKTFRFISNPKHKPNYAFSRNTFRESLYVLHAALGKLLPLIAIFQHIYVFISFWKGKNTYQNGFCFCNAVTISSYFHVPIHIIQWNHFSNPILNHIIDCQKLKLLTYDKRRIFSWPE